MSRQRSAIIANLFGLSTFTDLGSSGVLLMMVNDEIEIKRIS